MSAVLAVVAFILMKLELVRFAMISASVVLPVPEGPNNIIDLIESLSIASLSTEPSPSRCSCPKKSSRDFGLSKLANVVRILYHSIDHE